MVEIGIVLLLVGLVSLIFGISKKTTQVTASHGSVAVKGNKNAINNTVSTGKTPSSFWDVWNIVCGLATLAGLVLARVGCADNRKRINRVTLHKIYRKKPSCA